MIVSYIGENLFVCEMCGNTGKYMFLWKGIITKTKLHICKKCVKREIGKKKLEKLLENK